MTNHLFLYSGAMAEHGMNIIQALLLAVVEGITEFLPISSTGHMIITSYLFGIEETDYVKMYTVAIQLGAILSVVVLYWKEFFRSFDFYVKLFIAFIPSAIAGLLLGKYIDKLFENPVGVSIALIAGGVVLLYVNQWFHKNEYHQTEIKDVTYKKAFSIGLFQVIALFPGVSRSAATIIGGLSQKLNRKTAAEFSFFLAVPTMFAATAYKAMKYHKEFGFEQSDLTILLIGNVVAFVVALLAIKAFIGILNRFGFKIFGYYRIIAGALILILFALDKAKVIH